MKYIVLIIDGASGNPIKSLNNKTCLELARTPNLDALTAQGISGLANNVPHGMEPSSACACMSILGYDPAIYFSGRGPIEARSMGIRLEDGVAAFRCNLVTIDHGNMQSFSSGHIPNSDSHVLIDALNNELGSQRIHFYPGLGYRHICTIADSEDCLKAMCTPPHDISGKPIARFMPHGPGSDLLLELMKKSKKILERHPVNIGRLNRRQLPSNMIWLFWGGKNPPDFPMFSNVFGLTAAMTSGVDLLKGLAKLSGITTLEIPGVTDNIDNDHAIQGKGALEALDKFDMVFIHIEAPDEAAHEGNTKEKINAIEQIDELVVGPIRAWQGENLRVMVLPDHPTPVDSMTHSSDPVPFLLWGPGIGGNGAQSFTEAFALKTGLFIDKGHELLNMLINP